MSKYAKAYSVLERWKKHLLNIPGVKAVGITHINCNPTIAVIVESEDVVKYLPSSIEGVPVAYRVSKFRLFLERLLYTSPAFRSARVRPVPGGVGISSTKTLGGTFTCTVYDLKTSEKYGLSCNHVLAFWFGPVKKAEIGEPVIQPPKAYGGTEEDRIGSLFKVVPIEEDKENIVDAALFKPDDPAILDDYILDIGELEGWSHPLVGMEVRKSGLSTGTTHGIVTVTNATVKVVVEIEGKERVFTFTDVCLASATKGRMGYYGDSGSPVCEIGRAYIVGILFAGDEETGDIAFFPIKNVIKELNVSPVKERTPVYAKEEKTKFLATIGAVGSGIALTGLFTFVAEKKGK